MEKLNEITSLIQSTVVELYYAEKYCESYMLKAQKLGLQGEKRRLRYESTKYHNLVNYLKCDSYDLYGINVIMQHVDRPLQTVSSIQDYFRKVLEYTETMFDKFHSLANSFVIASARHYANCLYKQCDCLAEYVKEYRRILFEGDDSGWSEVYIQRLMQHETTAMNIHDHFEDREKSVGFDY